MASTVNQKNQPSPLLDLNSSTYLNLNLVVQESHSFAIGEHTDLCLSDLLTEDGKCKTVRLFFIYMYASVQLIILRSVPKVVKIMRRGFVEKQPELKDRIATVCRRSVESRVLPTSSQRCYIKGLCQFVQFSQSLDHPNVGSVLGLSNSDGPVPLLVLPLFSNGNIVRYLKRNSGKTDKEKIELVRTCLARDF
jgi:hypothetical protein